jgi:hypothetical protein
MRLHFAIVFFLLSKLFCVGTVLASQPVEIHKSGYNETTNDTTTAAAPAPKVSPWNLGGWLTVNGSQASFRNWSQGGVNNIAGSSTARFTAEYNRSVYVINHNTNLRYGQSRISGDGFRKTDDEIRIRNQIRRLLEDERFSIIAQLNFNSQFDKGYNNARTQIISRFFAPAYIIETVGFAYNPDKGYQIDFGISMRQTVVRREELRARYNLKQDELIRNEGGISIGVKMDREIMTNVVYSGQLDTFSNLLEPLNSSTVRFSNEIIGKINSYLTVNMELAFVYDDNITTELQVKQALSVGFSYRFL